MALLPTLRSRQKTQKIQKKLGVGTNLYIPTIILKWYFLAMANNVLHTVTLSESVDTDAGLLVMSTDEALTWLQSRLEGRDLVAELLAERRAEVERENA